jgi:hypothetical protein
MTIKEGDQGVEIAIRDHTKDRNTSTITNPAIIIQIPKMREEVEAIQSQDILKIQESILTKRAIVQVFLRVEATAEVLREV